MCGIAGIFGSNIDPKPVERMTEALRHRGPDDGDIWVSQDKHTALGHRRLSIVDLSPKGAQPMVSASGRYVTAYNGETYNFKSLRKELTDSGYHFNGGSDTEVMLAGIEAWGVEQCIRKMNGMFAAAVYDQKLNKFYIFRDRLGVKPLYYRWVNGRLYFSSELTPEFAGLGEKQIDRAALALYFRYYYIPAPHTIYEGVYKVLPGTLHEVTPESASRSEFSQTITYWNSVERINALSEERRIPHSVEESVDMVDSAIAASVKERMVADVPLGAFLSGGIDSSLIVAHMQRQSSQAVKTYTIGFPDPKFNEGEYAKEIAKHLGTDHTEFIVTEQDALDVIPKLPSMYGEPFADSSQIPTYLVSRLTRQSVTVALSGDGADELFSGYRSYHTLAKAQKYIGRVPSSIFAASAQLLRSKTIQKKLYNNFGGQRYEWIFNSLRLFSGTKESWIPRGIDSTYSLPEQMVLGITPGDSVLPFQRCRGNLTEQFMAHETCVYLPDDILTKVDRASMAVSLEVRAPFCDDMNLFDVAWKIPFAHKMNESGGKSVLKKALARHVPLNLFDRPKMGFSIPLQSWLNGPLNDWVQECTNSTRIKREGYLNVKEVENLVEKAKKGNTWHADKLWSVCVFQTWLDDFHGR